MRITFDHKKILPAILFLAAVFVSGNCLAQTPDSTKKKAGYSLDLYVGGGVSSYVADFPETPGMENKSVVKPIGCFRVMWQPDHRLALGLESGIVTWYSYDSKNDTASSKLKLTSIPILFTWSMPVVKNVKVFAGFGSYIMTSHLSGKNEVDSKTLSLGWSLAACYLQPLKKDLSLAYELKWYNANETRDGLVSAQVQLVWKFLQW